MLRDTIPGSSQRFKQDPVTGILLFYDQSRSTYISTDRETYRFGIGHVNINRPRWMILTGGGNTLTNGNLVPRNGVITCLSVSTKNTTTDCVFKIRSLIAGPDITSISLLGTSSNVIDNLAININQNDRIRVFADVISGKLDYPELSVEIAWR